VSARVAAWSNNSFEADGCATAQLQRQPSRKLTFATGSDGSEADLKDFARDSD